MSVKAQFFFGMDYWSCPYPLFFFLKQCHLHGLNVYECKVKDGKITFYASVFQRNALRKVFHDLNLIRTVGCLGFLFRQLIHPWRMISVLWSFCLFFLLNNTIMDVRYLSTSSELTNKIDQYLNNTGFRTPILSFDSGLENNLKGMIRQEFSKEIAWIEIKRNGSILEVSFNDKRYADTKELGNAPLIATKQAIITQFDVTHGEKKVKLNQLVYPGDVLVDNILYDAYNHPQSIYVEGKVWGKTWTTVNSELIVSEKNSFLEPIHYLRLIYDCRRQIENELTEGESVLSEQILELTRNGSTIKMKVHYTCFEEISGH